jgi:hypothetical protein
MHDDCERLMEWLVPERGEASRGHVPHSETARADRGLLRTGCGIAARSGPITRRVYQPRHNLREQASLGHQSLRRDDELLVLEPDRDRHSTGGRAADVRMMGAIEHETAVLGPMEERCDEGDVREVGPAQVGVVQDDHVSRCRVQARLFCNVR